MITVSRTEGELVGQQKSTFYRVLMLVGPDQWQIVRDNIQSPKAATDAVDKIEKTGFRARLIRAEITIDEFEQYTSA